MPLPDGVRLRTEVTVADDGERHPVLLVRTPYGRAFLRTLLDSVALAREGWAVVLQDVRGRWGSQGTFSAMRQEGADGAAAVAWCASQPWSAGRVAMTCGSYQGYAQWAAALERPPALRAIAPSISTPFLNDGWLREGGAFRVGAWALWCLSNAAAGTGGPHAAERRAAKAAASWRELVRYPTNVDAIAALVPQFREWIDPGSELLAHPAPNRLARVEVAGYHLAGWYDVFCEGTIAGYTALAERARSESVRRSQRLVVGPWAHATRFFQFTGEVDFGPEANSFARGIPQEELQFLRAAVDGQEVQAGVSVFLMGRNRWLELESWPPATTETPFYLAGDGALHPTQPERTGVDRYRHDPRDPVPTNGGRHLLGAVPPVGPVDQRRLEARDDVLVYTSEPLPAELTVVGVVRAKVRFASSASRADIAMKLVDVHPDGRALNVVDSVRRVDLTPGKPRLVEVAVGSTAMTFARGHRIRIEVASSNWPHFDCVEAADQTVHFGGRSGSRLLLPVYPG